jgi:hypothetical protein
MAARIEEQKLSPAPTADDLFRSSVGFALAYSPDDSSFRNLPARVHDLSRCPVLPMSENHCLRAAAHYCSKQRVAGFAKVRAAVVTSTKNSE